MPSQPMESGRQRRLIRVCALAAVIAGASAPALAVDLTVKVANMRSASGEMHVSVYDNPETFPNKKGMLRELIVKAEAPVLEVVFPGLPPGTYAVAAFHDENGNGEFDQGFLGFPLEDYAFSNDPTVIISAPDFAESAFTVSGAAAEISIRMTR
ncbi:MAG: DUF2141 domain-containing protein [Rhodospirillales bacterium]